VREAKGRRAGQRGEHWRGDDRGAIFCWGRWRSVDRVGAGGAPFSECQGRRQRDAGRRREWWIQGPKHLVQFAVMGGKCITARRFGSRKPRVGLLSIGEEESKGNEFDARSERTVEGRAYAVRWER